MLNDGLKTFVFCYRSRNAIQNLIISCESNDVFIFHCFSSNLSIQLLSQGLDFFFSFFSNTKMTLSNAFGNVMLVLNYLESFLDSNSLFVFAVLRGYTKIKNF